MMLFLQIQKHNLFGEVVIINLFILWHLPNLNIYKISKHVVRYLLSQVGTLYPELRKQLIGCFSTLREMDKNISPILNIDFLRFIA